MKPPGDDEAEARGGVEFEEVERGDHQGPEESEDGMTHRTAGRCLPETGESETVGDTGFSESWGSR